jgi:hypothetical protein
MAYRVLRRPIIMIAQLSSASSLICIAAGEVEIASRYGVLRILIDPALVYLPGKEDLSMDGELQARDSPLTY